MHTIIVNATTEEELRARTWWNNLESQWKMAFNEGLFGIGPTLEPPKAEFLIMMLTRVDKIRLSGPGAAHPNLSFQLTNLSGVAGLTSLNFLTVANAKIQDLTPLAHHYKLESLFLNNNRIAQLTGLENLMALKDLYLNVNEITDLRSLKKLTNLETLYVNYNKLTSLKGIKAKHAKKLRNFYVEPNDDLPHSEIVRVQLKCGILCRRG